MLPDAETAIESAKQGIDALTEKIAALETSIKNLEKGVTGKKIEFEKGNQDDR